MSDAATRKPNVRLDPPLQKQELKASTVELRQILTTAVDDLDACGAWRPELGDVRIVLFKVGLGEGKDRPPGVWTAISSDEEAPGSIVHRDTSSPVDILVDERVFVDGVGKKMGKLWSSKRDIAVWILGHELFHVDEFDRQEAAGILHDNRNSLFAQGARADFPQDWKTAVQKLTETYPTAADLTRAAQVAGMTVNEAAADMTALHYLAMAGRDWKGFGAKLVEFRTKEFERWLRKTNLPMIGSFFKGPMPYPIGASLNTLLRGGAVDIRNIKQIHAHCWEIAKQQLLLAPSDEQDPEIMSILSALPTLALPPSTTKSSQPTSASATKPAP